MQRRVVRAALLVLIPLCIYLGAGGLMQLVSGRTIHLASASNCGAAPAKCDLPLFLRLGGYDAHAAQAYWVALCDDDLESERRFQRLDLAFPLLYGAALGGALLLAWRDAGRPVPRALLLAPVAGAMLADWVENLVMLDALAGFRCTGTPATLDAGAIQLASLATQCKLVLAAVAAVTLVALVLGRLREG